MCAVQFSIVLNAVSILGKKEIEKIMDREKLHIFMYHYTTSKTVIFPTTDFE